MEASARYLEWGSNAPPFPLPPALSGTASAGMGGGGVAAALGIMQLEGLEE